jgi:hypothetical protein
MQNDSTNAAHALQESLKTLTERLKSVSSPYTMDVSQVGQTADAISKVSQALLHVQQLQRSYR